MGSILTNLIVIKITQIVIGYMFLFCNILILIYRIIKLCRRNNISDKIILNYIIKVIYAIFGCIYSISFLHNVDYYVLAPLILSFFIELIYIAIIIILKFKDIYFNDKNQAKIIPEGSIQKYKKKKAYKCSEKKKRKKKQ